MTEGSTFAQKYGPWALVAGASQGLGAEYARQLAQRGLNLVLVARNADRLHALAGRLQASEGVQVRPLVLDLADEDAAQVVDSQAADLEVGLLVYNAAYAPVSRFFDLSLEDHLRSLDTNCRTALALTYLLGRRMVARRRGGILLLSSLSATQGSAFIANYVATKAYDLTLAEGLWDELRSAGVDVLGVMPSSVSTPNYGESLPPGAREAVKATPMETVVRESLARLGKGPAVVPGFGNRAASFVLTRLMPRWAAIRLLGSVLKRMYAF